MLQVVNYLNKKQKQQKNSKKNKTTTTTTTPQPNPDGSQPPRPEQLPQPPVPGLNIEVNSLLKYFSIFLRYLDLPLINCETEFDLSWIKECVLLEHDNTIAGATFQINNVKFMFQLLCCL